MERIQSQRSRRTLPIISVEKGGQVNFNPAAMDLLGMSPGDKVYIYWDADREIVAVEPHEEGDYTLSARTSRNPDLCWGSVRSKPLKEQMGPRRGNYLATVNNHPDDPARKLIQADLS